MEEYDVMLVGLVKVACERYKTPERYNINYSNNPN